MSGIGNGIESKWTDLQEARTPVGHLWEVRALHVGHGQAVVCGAPWRGVRTAFTARAQRTARQAVGCKPVMFMRGPCCWVIASPDSNFLKHLLTDALSRSPQPPPIRFFPRV